MAGKLGTTFTYTERYMEAINEVSDTQLRNKLNYDLCFYGVYGILPDDASDMSALFIKSVEALIQGSHDYQKGQAEKGKKGGRPSKVSDEEIKGAILDFYRGHGKLPSNSELGAIVGLSGGAIRQREPWKQKEGILADFLKENQEEEKIYDTLGF